jgi:hypothetical protein
MTDQLAFLHHVCIFYTFVADKEQTLNRRSLKLDLTGHTHIYVENFREVEDFAPELQLNKSRLYIFFG